MSENRSAFPRGRVSWIIGTVVLIGLGVLFGMVFANVWLGLILGAVASLGWVLAYESWRGRNVGVNDDDHGIQL